MRHFFVCMLISACCPFFGLVAAVYAGRWYEKHTHDGVIPCDEGTKMDLSLNLFGASVGQIIAVVWFISLNPLGV